MKALLPSAGLYLIAATLVAASPAYPADVKAREAVAHPHSEHPHLSVDKNLAVDQVYQAAMQLAPEQALGGAYQQQAEAQRRVGRGLIANRPRINLNYWDDQAGDSTGLQESELGVAVDLWRWGERRNARALAESFNSGSQDWQSYQRLLVSGRLRQVLHQLKIRAARRQHAVDAVADAQRLLAVSETRFKAGAIPRAAVMQSETLLLAARQQLLEHEAELVDAERQYVTLTGLQRRPETFSEALPQRRQIDQYHPQLRLLLTRRQQHVQKLAQQRHQAAGNSTVSLGVRRERGSDSEPAVDSFGVSVSIPFGGSAYADAASSEAAVALADIDVQIKRTRLQLQQQLHEVEHQLDVLAESIDFATRARDLAQRQWQMAEKAFVAGESDIRPTILALQHYRQSQVQWQVLTLRRDELISSLRQTVGEPL
ncbi:TolC family protein [Spongiibacter nanhainus]|uniref:TolC family protein n=1 Tax=Spongiibacter nanhainus TaxID=2794344 RepID=A0A7T4R1M6_9GAMM|nr:TolC family protein [Spongiibacter nanhainus]QQD18597.1 TolC family protein [Spongiibacter nanhainus]